MKKIIAIAGSNSKESINHKLLEAVLPMVKENKVELLRLCDFDSPLYGIDRENEEGMPQKMIELNEIFNSADGFLISTPEHNGSMSAAFKNTIDWLSRIEGKIFRNKPTVFLSTSPGPRGAMTALDHLTTIMPHRGANVVGSKSVGEFSKVVSEGMIVDQEIANSLQEIIVKLEENL